jgi:formate hydrogenlyase subunit 6/NADH:ubiquinone oxidoreductase subunit I
MGFNSAFKLLTFILLTWRIRWAPKNASKWQMGFNSAFKWLTFILLTWRIWPAPSNASRWQMGFYSAFKGLISIPQIRTCIICKFCVCLQFYLIGFHTYKTPVISESVFFHLHINSCYFCHCVEGFPQKW